MYKKKKKKGKKNSAVNDVVKRCVKIYNDVCREEKKENEKRRSHHDLVKEELLIDQKTDDKKRVKWADKEVLYEEIDENSEENKRGNSDTIRETESNKLLFSEKELNDIKNGDFIGENDKIDSELEEKLQPVSNHAQNKETIRSNKSNCYVYSTDVKDKNIESSRMDDGYVSLKKDNGECYLESKVDLLSSDMKCFSLNDEVPNEENQSSNKVEDNSEKHLTEEDWLNWFAVELQKGEEQTKAKTVRTETKNVSLDKDGTKELLETHKVPVSNREEKNKNEYEDKIMYVKGDFMNMRAIGSLEGFSLPILIDTGAGQSMISRKLWQDLGRPTVIKINQPVKWNQPAVII